MEAINWAHLLSDCIEFAQRLIQTPSMPGKEERLAALVAEELRRLNFDQVWLDDAGYVSGRIIGRDRELGAVVLNSHLDHVDPGDVSLWPYPPHSAEVVQGRLHGRGACDIKGPLAVQVYSMATLVRANQRPLRDLVFCGVVEEEVGGAGAVYWAEHLDYDVDLIVLGEPSSNHLSLGHRGIRQMWVKFAGRSVHASVPERGINPNLILAEFLLRLERMKAELPGHELLGQTTVAPTLIEVDTTSMNVTPAWARVLLDFRTAAMSVNEILAFVAKVADGFTYEVSDAWTKAADSPPVPSDEKIFGYYTSPKNDKGKFVRDALERGMGWRPKLSRYQFATDGRHFTSTGATIVGFSPGEEELAHTVDESISLEMMADSLRGYVELLRSY
ncbi:MAG: M20/M25/M40 family metallo-hydrolase [Chloroflexota bacterium]|nr:MAG: M20/M25/M40 family metallo-hydrolase [Chloroflexota bacterium]